MELEVKIQDALRQALDPEFMRIENDDGISGFVVSRSFEGQSSLDRQGRLDAILRNALAQEERRQVLMIAALTPAEYDSVGAKIRVQKVKETASGVEIVLRGGSSEAEYVRAALDLQKGIQTTEPKPVNGAIAMLMSFRARGTEAHPLTKEKAIRVLRKDQYIEVVPNA